MTSPHFVFGPDPDGTLPCALFRADLLPRHGPGRPGPAPVAAHRGHEGQLAIHLDAAPDPIEDAEAGDLGVPLTQVEDDEEWVGWVDWASAGSVGIAAAAGPSSS